MGKNIFSIDDDKQSSNTYAGIASIIVIASLSFLNKPTEVYQYVIYVSAALFVGGLVYFICECIRKKSMK